MNAAIVLQARMASARLPGKVLALVGGRPMVAWCIDRLRAASRLPVVLATTTGHEDDVLCSVADDLGIPIVRGATDDVLSRYLLAAETFDLTHIVRATADNPAVDIDAPRRTIDMLHRTGAAYVTECGLPHGTAVEAFSVEALRIADDTTDDADDREHVTPFLRRERSVVSVDALGPAPLRRPDVRLTVDLPDDLAYIREVFDAVGDRVTRAPLADIISAADFVRSQMLLRGAVRR